MSPRRPSSRAPLRHAARLSALLLLAAPTAHAVVSLRGQEALSRLLKNAPPCCVIDGRSQPNRQRAPLEQALVYRDGLRITPTATIVVVADSDRQAMTIGRALDKSHPGKTILAVKGGVRVWRATMQRLGADPAAAAAGAPTAGGMTFVIPHNTCEVGAPLQILQSKPQ